MLWIELRNTNQFINLYDCEKEESNIQIDIFTRVCEILK